MRRAKHRWRPFYGWRRIPKVEEMSVLDGDGQVQHRQIGWQKLWSHVPGALLAGAPAGTSKEGAFYIVWSDRTLRRITKQAYDLLAKVPPISRVPMLQGKKTLKEAA